MYWSLWVYFVLDVLITLGLLFILHILTVQQRHCFTYCILKLDQNSKGNEIWMGCYLLLQIHFRYIFWFSFSIFLFIFLCSSSFSPDFPSLFTPFPFPPFSFLPSPFPFFLFPPILSLPLSLHRYSFCPLHSLFLFHFYFLIPPFLPFFIFLLFLPIHLFSLLTCFLIQLLIFCRIIILELFCLFLPMCAVRIVIGYLWLFFLCIHVEILRSFFITYGMFFGLV